MAVTRILDVAGSGDYTDLATAINAFEADSDPDWTIRVVDGTYNGANNRNISIAPAAATRTLIIEAFTADSVAVIFDGQNSGYWLRLNSANLTTLDLTDLQVKDYTTAVATGGGAVQCTVNATITIDTCIFRGNDSTGVGSGGAICMTTGSLICSYTTFGGPIAANGNTSAGPAGAVELQGGGSATFSYCTFQYNTAVNQGGALRTVVTSAFDLICTDCTWQDNSTSGVISGGAVCIRGGDNTFERCTIDTNSTQGDGGGLHFSQQGGYVTILIDNCLVVNNTANVNGGGVYCSPGGSGASIVNTTVADNTATTGEGGGCYLDTGAGRILEARNCVLMDNSCGGVLGDFYVDLNATLNFCYGRYTAGEIGGTGIANVTNSITTDPLFEGGGDYHLQTISPCKDVGLTAYVPPGIIGDLDRNPRVVDTAVDMGCYEIQGSTSYIGISRPRLCTLPNERSRGIRGGYVFSEHFVSAAEVIKHGGSISGVTFDSFRAVCDGASHIYYQYDDLNLPDGSDAFTLIAVLEDMTSGGAIEAAVTLGGTAGANNTAWIGILANGNIGGGLYGAAMDSGVAANSADRFVVALTYAGGVAGALRLYVDNTQQANTTGTADIDSDSVQIGRVSVSATDYFDGKVSEVRIFNVELSAGELAVYH